MSEGITVPLIPDCSACIVNSLKTLIPLLTQDESDQFKLFNLAYKRISEGYAKNLTPIILSVTLYQELYEKGEVEDPYKEIKQRSRKAAMRALPTIEKKIEQYEGKVRFRACLSASISGNVIDFNTAEHSPDLESLIEVFETVQSEGFALDDSEHLWESLQKRKGKVLFIADNAGEVILDIPLLRIINEFGWEISFVVKGRAMINDATIEDIQGTEIEELATVTDSGAWAHGVPKEFVSKEFLKLAKACDLIISKGQANIETVPDIQQLVGVETYYITKAKCSHISRAIGANKGDNVVLRILGTP
ncbi:MAG: DUF89 domain-containing protein [Candidatus Thorarchaeota archaeon]